MKKDFHILLFHNTYDYFLYIYYKMVYRKTQGGKKLQKRFYFDATIGKNVPIVGGTGLRFGTGALAKRNLTAAVKDIVHKKIEATQYKIFDGTVTGLAMAHSTLYTLNLLGNIPRGDAWNNRNGDIIHLSCIELTLQMYANTTQGLRNSITFKYWVIRDEDEYLSGTDTVGSGVGSNKFINSPNYTTAGIWDPKRVSVVASGQHIFNPTVDAATGSVVHKSDKILICPGAKFTFETNSNFGKNPNYYLVITSSVYGGSIGTTTTGACFIDGMIKFKNSQ